MTPSGGRRGRSELRQGWCSAVTTAVTVKGPEVKAAGKVGQVDVAPHVVPITASLSFAANDGVIVYGLRMQMTF